MLAMNFTSFDLGTRKRGELVQVTLSGHAANVRLMDSTNFNAFKAGRKHRYHGGNAKKSPVLLEVPSSGRWYLAVDYGGHKARGRAGVQILPGALPDLRPRSVSSLPHSLIRQQSPGLHSQDVDALQKSYDVFISHASEDKDEVVRPLAHALAGRQLDVWYDEFELRIGDSLRRKIDNGLANSRFGIVVLSPDFFRKDWPNYELDGLVTKGVTGEQVLLPIWHKVTKAEVIDYSPSLADKIARSTSTHTVDEIADEICSLIAESVLMEVD